MGSRRERECRLSHPPLHPHTPQTCSTPEELKEEHGIEGRWGGKGGGERAVYD